MNFQSMIKQEELKHKAIGEAPGLFDMAVKNLGFLGFFKVLKKTLKT